MLIMTHETSVFLGGLFARICLGSFTFARVRSEITRVRVAEPLDARVCGSHPGSQTPRVLGSSPDDHLSSSDLFSLRQDNDSILKDTVFFPNICISLNNLRLIFSRSQFSTSDVIKKRKATFSGNFRTHYARTPNVPRLSHIGR